MSEPDTEPTVFALAGSTESHLPTLINCGLSLHFCQGENFELLPRCSRPDDIFRQLESRRCTAVASEVHLFHPSAPQGVSPVVRLARNSPLFDRKLRIRPQLIRVRRWDSAEPKIPKTVASAALYLVQKKRIAVYSSESHLTYGKLCGTLSFTIYSSVP